MEFNERKHRNAMSRLPVRVVVAMLALGLVLAGCASGDSSSSDSSADSASFAETEDAAYDESGDMAAEEMAAFDEDREQSEAGGGGSDNEDATSTTVSTGSQTSAGQTPGDATTAPPLESRRIIFEATVDIEVDDVATASAAVTDSITKLGGFLYGQETHGGPESSAVLVFKIEPSGFQRALAAVGSVGELRSQSVTADDVTERIVDLQTRIEVAEMGVERLAATLADTDSLTDYAEVERLLLERESNLEVMRAQLRGLDERVRLSTITVNLRQDQVNRELSLGVSLYEAHDDGQSCSAPGAGQASNENWSVPARAEVTVCYAVTNLGEGPVTELALVDPPLGVTSWDDTIVVFGNPDRLEPGETLLAAVERRIERPVRLTTKVTGRPAAEDGSPLPTTVDVGAQHRVDTFAVAEDPGFGDGFDAGLSLISGLWTAVKVAVGFLLPLLVLVPLVAAAWWLWRRVRSGPTAEAASADEREADGGSADDGEESSPTGGEKTATGDND